MPSLSDFFRTQFLVKIPIPSTSFATKTVIITGANGGLGQETAKHIIRLGAAKVVFGCRSLARGEQAKLDIETQLSCDPSIIEVWELDLESPSSIKKFAERANNLPRLDVLINNAGIQSPKFKLMYDTERTLAVNCIGTFLLAFQLIPKLRETGGTYGVTPHMTTVGSALYDVAVYPSHPGADIFSWFKDEKNMKPMNQYVFTR
jgi:NAD(P)-dependent dehydrogenase (short-subunit alcohol dehydrogenase family)